MPESLNRAPGPLVHGLTLGEMARLGNARLARPAKLTVIAMDGWKRSMTWRDTGRPWIPPSPNLRSAEAAMAYPGTCLLEGTNVSEGRGSETPFLRFGAPWLGASPLAVDVPGFRLVAERFTPRASPAAPAPKFDGVEVQGFRVEVTDPRAATHRLGVALLAGLSRRARLRVAPRRSVAHPLVGTPSCSRRSAPARSTRSCRRRRPGAWRDRETAVPALRVIARPRAIAVTARLRRSSSPLPSRAQEGHGRADQGVPGPGERRREVDRGHRRQADDQRDERGALADAAR